MLAGRVYLGHCGVYPKSSQDGFTWAIVRLTSRASRTAPATFILNISTQLILSERTALFYRLHLLAYWLEEEGEEEAARVGTSCVDGRDDLELRELQRSKPRNQATQNLKNF